MGRSAYGKKSSVLTDHVSPAACKASRYIDGVEYMMLTDPFCGETSSYHVPKTDSYPGSPMMSLSRFLNHIGAFI